MNSSIETKRMIVDVQENGLIRDSAGLLIGKLLSDVNFSSLTPSGQGVEGEVVSKYQAQWFEGKIHSIRELLEKAINEAMNKNIEKMVDKFLMWELPKTVYSDLCVTMHDYPHTRLGTNLLTATEAKEMLQYLFSPHTESKEEIK